MPIARSSVLWGHVLDQQPIGSVIWPALAWCVGLPVLGYAFATVAYRRRIRR